MAIQYDLMITSGAADDIESIRDFNEGRKMGLGSDYLEDIIDCLDRIQKKPYSFQYYQRAIDGIRRGLSNRFSVIILYQIDSDQNRIEVLTVADSRQDWF